MGISLKVIVTIIVTSCAGISLLAGIVMLVYGDIVGNPDLKSQAPWLIGLSVLFFIIDAVVFVKVSG